MTVRVTEEYALFRSYMNHTVEIDGVSYEVEEVPYDRGVQSSTTIFGRGDGTYIVLGRASDQGGFSLTNVSPFNVMPLGYDLFGDYDG